MPVIHIYTLDLQYASFIIGEAKFPCQGHIWRSFLKQVKEAEEHNIFTLIQERPLLRSSVDILSIHNGSFNVHHIVDLPSVAWWVVCVCVHVCRLKVWTVATARQIRLQMKPLGIVLEIFLGQR